jgi:siroheme synthase (precorrin-2 oxidase/ferrochelatase)
MRVAYFKFKRVLTISVVTGLKSCMLIQAIRFRIVVKIPNGKSQIMCDSLMSKKLVKTIIVYKTNKDSHKCFIKSVYNDILHIQYRLVGLQ